jgi:hypothetical protein
MAIDNVAPKNTIANTIMNRIDELETELKKISKGMAHFATAMALMIDRAEIRETVKSDILQMTDDEDTKRDIMKSFEKR